MDLSLPRSLKLFDKKNKTIVFNTVKHEEQENLVLLSGKKRRKSCAAGIERLVSVKNIFCAGGRRR
jgi:hypothetical protein